MIVVLVDMSGSTNSARRTVYREAFEKIFQDLRQGDRIMVGTITGRSFIDFKPVVDSEIPKKSIWVNRIQFEQKLTNTREEIRREVEKLLSRKRGTPRTEILNSLNIADTIFHDEKRKKILVILSDMIQDSKEYNFSTVKVT
ncbi:MAG: VWA domain-containing protein, partial [Deltaproteobacteria bacterium]|nr:VWA domain-containing protein [Deltaproteobacteria bacterium]